MILRVSNLSSARNANRYMPLVTGVFRIRLAVPSEYCENRSWGYSALQVYAQTVRERL